MKVVPPIGAPVSISIRRDRIHVAKAAAATSTQLPNSIAGNVESTEYEGHYVKLNIITDCGTVFVAHVPDDDYFAQPMRPGDRVISSWKPKQIHILWKVDSLFTK